MFDLSYMLCDPHGLLADEPAESLVATTREEIMALRRGPCTEPGHTVVLITHHDTVIAARTPRVLDQVQRPADKEALV